MRRDSGSGVGPPRPPATGARLAPWPRSASRPGPLAAAGLVAAGWLAACGAPRAPFPLDPHSPAVAPEGALPPIPAVSGPLALRVQYPDSLQRVAARDSTFLFGSVGTGDATLVIDGHLVPVEPNGAFLAWLPLPLAERGDTAFYRLVARSGAVVDSLLHPILLPSPPPEGGGVVWIDTTALPAAARWALPNEPLDIEVRAAPGLRVWLEGPAPRSPITSRPAARPAPIAELAERSVAPGRYGVALPAGELAEAACRELEPCASGPDAPPLPLAVVATDGTDTARAAVAWPLWLLDPARLPVVELREAPDPVNGSDGVVVGRPVAYGPYRWRFPVGTRAEVDGRSGDRLRLRLVPALHAWVTAEDAALLTAGTPAPRSVIGDLGAVPYPGRLSLRIPLAAALPVHVEEPDERTLEIVLYGGLGATDRIAHGAGETLLEAIRWEQEAGPSYRLVLRFRRPVWGYRLAYETEGGGRAALRLEVHRPPTIDPGDPLRDRRIAIDPGHPHAGAYGPTGLYEGDANLGIARRLAELLREAGAAPILIRDDTLPLGLYHRTSIAEDAGAELFVSIHNNALADGVRPFGREGTSTYYYHEHSRELASAVQRGMVGAMGLRDLGIYWADLAVVRMAWMPAVLAEGAFMMHPRHEAGLRTPEFREAYARGVVEGIRAFLRTRADGGS